MTQPYGNTGGVSLVAIDVAKRQNAVLIQLPGGARKKLTVTNDLHGYRELAHLLKKLKMPCKIGFEVTGNYHRTLAFYLRQQGFDLELISSVAAKPPPCSTHGFHEGRRPMSSSSLPYWRSRRAGNIVEVFAIREERESIVF